MEDSYTVHRRRKAAARKREKTPDPSSRGASHMDATDDEDEERRARMERMAEEAEKMEQQQDNRLSQQDASKEPENKREKKKDQQEPQPAARRKDRHSVNVDDMVAIRVEVAAKSSAGNSPKTRETDAAAAATVAGDNTRPVKQAVEAANNKSEDGTTKKEAIKPEVTQVVKEKAAQDTSETAKEATTTGEIAKSSEVRKVERRLKRRSKERVERYSRSTDSSEVDEKSESSRRRTKSPEAPRARLKKTSGKSRGSSDPEAQKKDTEKLSREKRSSSRHKLEDTEPRAKESSEKSRPRPYSQTEDTEPEEPKVMKKRSSSGHKLEDTEPRAESSEKSRPRPYSQTEDTEPEEPKVMKKSESFPQKSVEERVIKRSSTDLKKQIIPLSNDSLIEDFARAQRQYLRRRSILDPEPADEFQDATEVSLLRRRKLSLTHADSEDVSDKKIVQEVVQPSDATGKSSWFSWLAFWCRKKVDQKDKEDKGDKDVAEEKIEDEPKPTSKAEETKATAMQEAPEKVTLLDFFRALKDVVSEFKAFMAQNPRETTIMRRMRNRCAAGLILIIIYCGLGAFVFRFIEGAFETFYKCGVKRVKRDFLDSLWNYSHNLREDDWKSMARKKLMEFEEQLHTAHEAGVHSYSGQKSWSFLNAVGYCLSVITTIGEDTS